MVKIADVAKHAKVAPSTVSYVLSGKRPISPEVRRRVEESIRALGYQPHAGARALASRRTNIIALVIPLRTGVHVPVLMRFVTAVTARARQFDHDVLLLTQGEGERGLQRVQGSSLADAIIVMDDELNDERLPLLRDLETPAVLIGSPRDSTDLTCIDLDFHAAGAKCVAHLADLGHRHVALVGTTARVADGAHAAAATRGVEVATRMDDHVTGVIVQNVPALESWLHTLRPDVAVVAICPDEVAERLDLTAVALPAEDVGRRAVELAMAKLDGEPVDAETVLAPTLTIRASTAYSRSSQLAE
ncbi:LacI family DNA-binding transcriptional regulator [Tenggerimyces flavus]|uniref:LacI family DNA-binding transcriptional regulator n=1 Tax=Tenggerimyces flavus TaxID=1708749 RepID=A0ABV7Y5H3_9ACTN|nr:LacI family DNA-binding transcriptional regulator [Tenggerimyces flavus]MBM7790746.1 DNA-binding LacI/PurR family transcriptional regulator [Tenggerimyces flavus]